MDYPNNFNIPVFPAGKTIAFSRRVSVWISIVFFFIVVACGFVLLGRHLKTNYPFLISVDPFTEEWTVVAFPKQGTENVPHYQFIQEKLVKDYVLDWFTISADTDENNEKWRQCSTEECTGPEQFNPNNTGCAIYCKSSAKLFSEFYTHVLPQYKAMIDMAGETWTVVGKKLISIGATESGSQWQVYATIKSAVMGVFTVLAFVDVARDVDLYPATFGYYIKQFNSYRISQ